jgi:hypothetical protein
VTNGNKRQTTWNSRLFLSNIITTAISVYGYIIVPVLSNNIANDKDSLRFIQGASLALIIIAAIGITIGVKVLKNMREWYKLTGLIAILTNLFILCLSIFAFGLTS